MEKIKKFISKYWLFILLTAVATILAIFYFSNQNNKDIGTEKEKLIPLIKPEINNQSSLVPQINQLEDNFPSLNKSLMVYQVDNYVLTHQEAIDIAQEFGFKENPEVTSNEVNGQIYLWSNEISNLSIYFKEGIINYGFDLLQNPELIQGEAPSPEEAEINFKNFLKKINFLTSEKVNLELKKTYYIKLKNGYFDETTKEDPQKNLVNLEFVYKLNNYEIQGFNPIIIDVFLDSQFKIVNLRSQKIFQKIEELDLYPLKDKAEILQILRNKPQLSFLKDLNSSPQSEIPLEYGLKKLRQINFNKIELIYFKNKSYQSYLQPVYLITGDAYLENIGWLQAGLYLPAIKDDYLLK